MTDGWARLGPLRTPREHNVSQHPAGWHPDPAPGGHGQERFWDGQQWTDQTRPLTQPARHMVPPAEQASEPTPARTGTPWFRKRWALPAAVGFAGLLLGVGIGASGGSATTAPIDPQKSAEYKALADKLDAADAAQATVESELATAKSDLQGAQTQLGDLPAAQKQFKADRAKLKQQLKEDRAKLKQDQAKLDARAKAVAAKERAVAARERKVGIVEHVIAQNTIPGDGVFRVGVDMTPGLYKTPGRAGCYYAVNGDANGNNILSNNIIDGPAVVSVTAGTFFESRGCADWILQR